MAESEGPSFGGNAYMGSISLRGNGAKGCWRGAMLGESSIFVALLGTLGPFEGGAVAAIDERSCTCFYSQRLSDGFVALEYRMRIHSLLLLAYCISD